MTTIGFVGLGSMGSAMAGRLVAAGHDVRVWNRSPDSAAPLVDAGANPNDLSSGFTPLHAVAWVRRPDASDTGDPPPIGSGRLTSLEFVAAMVERGANVNARLSKGAPRPPNSATRLGT